MSDLQLSLIGVGMALVGGVFAYNKWQERKHRKLAERVFRGDHADVLLGKRQPQEGEAASGLPEEPERIEPVLQPGGAPLPEGSAESPTLRAEAEPPQGLADPAIDCVVRFESAEPIGGPYLWQAQQQAFAKLAKPVCWSGVNERSGLWERLTANGAGDYRRLRAALQLADRRGPLSDSELSLFFNGVQRLADEFLAVADVPPRNETLARAAEIDRFCAGVDIQIGVNVVATGAPFPGTKLRGLAEAAGMTLGEDGMFHSVDGEGATQFTLSSLETAPFDAAEMKSFATHGVSFVIDVPRVAAGPQAYDRMIALAKQFAISLGGKLVDDNRASLPDSALDVIHDKIVEIGQRMASQGLIAGGPQALRLFS